MSAESNSTCNFSHLTLDQKQFFDDYIWWVETAGNLVFGMIGAFLNIITIIVLSSSTMLNNFFNRLLISLAVFDTLYLSCEISEVFRHRHNTFIQQQIFVYFTYPMRNIFMFSSVYMTMMLAFERYQAITNPVTYRIKMVGTSMNSQLISNVTPGLLFSVVYYIPKFLDLTVGEDTKCTFNNVTKTFIENASMDDALAPEFDETCITNYVLVPTSLRLDPQYIFWYIIVSNLTLTALVPSAVLIFLNTRIMTSLKNFNNRRNSLKTLKTSNSLPLSLSEKKNASAAKSSNTDLKKTFILFGIVILFVLCHSLRIALNVNEFIEVAAQKVTSDGEVCRKERIWKEYAGPFNQLLVIINSSLNFFIYVFFDNAFQQVLRTHLHMKNPFQCTCGNGDNKRCNTNGKSTIKSDVELNYLNHVGE